MIATQYKIILPSDYDMSIIKERVRNNGYKTNGFEDLKFKLYLITEKGQNNNLQNSYCPLYLWKDSNGLNKFLFDGFYDNIITSFGWQNIDIGVPLIDKTTGNFKDIKYLFEVSGEISPQKSLKSLKVEIEEKMPEINGAEFIVIYNPDKWKYNIYYFLNDINKVRSIRGIAYSILHISR